MGARPLRRRDRQHLVRVGERRVLGRPHRGPDPRRSRARPADGTPHAAAVDQGPRLAGHAGRPDPEAAVRLRRHRPLLLHPRTGGLTEQAGGLGATRGGSAKSKSA